MRHHLERLALVFALGVLAGLPCTGHAQSPANGDFIYRAQIRDTLIGLGQRLLRQPKLWREIQRRNNISNPRRIELGTPIRIPYAWLRLTPETATVSTIAGSAHQGDNVLMSGQILAEGSVIETGTDGSVTLNLAGGSIVTLQKSGTLRLEEMQGVTGAPAAHDIRLGLRSGRLQTTVKPHGDVGRFEIVTPVAVSAVRGTQFRSAVDPGPATAATETLKGTVAVESPHGAVMVPASFGTRVTAASAPLQPVPLLPAPDLTALPGANTTAVLRVQWPAVSGARGYRLQLAPDPDFHSIRADIDTSCPEVNLPAPEDGPYWVRVHAIDSLGLEGLDAVAALKQHQLLAAPVPVTPAAQARVTGERAEFGWTGVPGAARYRFQLARDAAFSDTITERDTEVSRSSVARLEPQRYYWRVASIDASGKVGDWSTAQSFAQRPSGPEPAAPRVTAHAIQLEWAEQPGARYRVQIAHDAAFKEPVFDQTVAAPHISAPRFYPGTYYAHVQVIDTEGNADPFGEARAFDVRLPRWLAVVPVAGLPALIH